ncbi:LuxR C-terminal-related transcriptional regulator [Synergistaceae bacterium OttesenSCG-928-I11]|nr:LuxR C-terminal-related transcriptional regulator [Synergistaceae bacterium OttesenSCG-928-I11]
MSQSDKLPLRQGMLHRPRLHALIEKGLRYPLLVMLAGPGYGKTQAMADYLAQCDANVLWLRLNALDNLPAHFWSHLIQALGRAFAGTSEQLRSLEFPDNLSKFDAFQQFLSNEICREKRVIWVFDDFGEIEERKVRDFFRMLAEVELDNFRFTLMSNALDNTESIAFMTSRRFLILGHDLRFTGDEISDLYRMYDMSLEPGERSGIERYTEGWPLPLHLLVLQRNKLSESAYRDGRMTHRTISHMFEERFFGTYPKEQQKLLVKLSLPNAFTEDLARALCERDSLDPDVLENHVFIAKEPSMGRYSYHHLYGLFLRKKRHLLNPEEERLVWQKAAEHYVSSGETMEAISCYRACGDHASMLNAMCDFVRMRHGITAENASFLLEHVDLLTPEEVRRYPIADYLRALIYLNMLELEKAETLLWDLEQKLLPVGTSDAFALLGEVYAMLGSIHMMRNLEDFGDYYRKAADYLPDGARLQGRRQLSAGNNHCFFMADNLPGARERMERAVQSGVSWMNRVLRGGMSGMEHLFSAEAAYLSDRHAEAQQHAYRAIYKAVANTQHDIVCNGYCLLARIGLMQGDFAEMTGQIQNVAEYAERHEIGVLKEIRDTALAWYCIKLRDHRQIPKSILTMNNEDRPVLAYNRSQIVYANYLIQTGEYARLAGMMEYPKGLYLTRGIWPDRICLYIMLAIAHHHLGNSDAAMKALWSAYDMSHENELITLFVEAEEHMCALLDAARRQRTYAFAPAWLDLVHERTAFFVKRAAALRGVYRKQNPVRKAENNPLTRREMEVLRALSRGLTREEIAVERFISVNTVKTFIRSIYHKLGAANRAEAVSIAISQGYLDMAVSDPA